MTTVTKLRVGRSSYYLEPVQSGAERPGRWYGPARLGLGLGQEVRPSELVALFELRAPGGAELRKPSDIRAIDVTLAAPKSVSVLWALGRPEVSGQIEHSLRQATSVAADYLERRGLRVRQDRPARGIAAAFEHRTSRAGDPHLHTHLVVLNLAEDEEGRWWARDWNALRLQSRIGGALFHAELRYQMTTRLGLDWGPPTGAVRQLSSVSPALRGVFSSRRAEVLEVMERYGGRSARSAELAALETRTERGVGSLESLRQAWVEQAGPEGQELADLRARPREAVPTPEPALGGLDVAGLSSFSRGDVVLELAQRSVAVPARLIEDRTDRLLASPDARALGPRVTRSGDLARAGARWIVVPSDRERWVSVAALEAARQGELALRRIGSEPAIGANSDPGRLEMLLRPLPPDLATAVRPLLSAAERLVLVSAPEAPRRDALVSVLQQGWEAAGVRVMVASTEGRPGPEAAALSGVDVLSLGRLEAGFNRLGHSLAQPTAVILLGAEALGEVGLARLATAVDRTGARLVLVSGRRGLPTVDRSGGLEVAERVLGVRHLSREHAWADTGEASRVIDPGPGLSRVGRVVVGPDPEALRRVLVSDWAESLSLGPAVMVTQRIADIDDLNARARRCLVETGRLGEVGPSVGGLELRRGESLVVAQVGRRGGGGYAVGDRVGFDGQRLLSPRGAALRAEDLGTEVRLRHAYALTPYLAARRPGARQLVLGAPGNRVPGSASVHYLVGRPSEARTWALEVERPAYLIEHLGPPPEGRGREQWREAAVAIEDYRSRWGISDPRRALGGPAGPGRQGVERQETERLVERARNRISAPSRERAENVRARERPGRSVETGLDLA